MYGKPSGLFSRSCSPKTLMLSAADAGVAVTTPPPSAIVTAAAAAANFVLFTSAP
jgi:hypothetical protein